MKKGTTNAAPKPNGKGTNNTGIVSLETAKLIHFLFDTPMEKIPIKKVVRNEKF